MDESKIIQILVVLTKLRTRQLKNWSMSPGRVFSLLYRIQIVSGALQVGPLINMVPGLFPGVKADRSRSGPLTFI